MNESGIRFGATNHLAGTLTIPDRPCDVGLILLSAGLLHRVGPHRLHVKLAREAAQRGITALRFDMPGLGDSATAPGRDSYEAQALQAARDAMDVVSSRTGARRFVVAGLCSGADASYAVACEDARIEGLFMMEPAYYPNRFSSALRFVRRLTEYGPRLAAARLWQLARSGELLRMLTPSGNDEGDGRAAPGAEAFSGGLEMLAARGVHLALVYSASSMGTWDLRQHRRRLFAKLEGSPSFRVELLPGTDHLFTPMAAKELLTQRLIRLLETVKGPQLDAAADEPAAQHAGTMGLHATPAAE